MSRPRLQGGITEDVKQLYRETEDIKLRQRVGMDVSVIQRTTSGSTWDVTTSIPDLETRRIRVKFTPDNGGRPYAEMDFDYDVSILSDDKPTLEPDPNSAGYTDKLSWIVRFDNAGPIATVTFKLKAYVSCADSGTLSFEVF